MACIDPGPGASLDRRQAYARCLTELKGRLWRAQDAGGGGIVETFARNVLATYSYGASEAILRTDEARDARDRTELARFNAMEQAAIAAPTINGGGTKAPAANGKIPTVASGAAAAIAPAANGTNGAAGFIALGILALVAWVFLRG